MSHHKVSLFCNTGVIQVQTLDENPESFFSFKKILIFCVIKREIYCFHVQCRTDFILALYLFSPWRLLERGRGGYSTSLGPS